MLLNIVENAFLAENVFIGVNFLLISQFVILEKNEYLFDTAEN